MIIANQNVPTPAVTGTADVRSGATRPGLPDAADASNDPSVPDGQAFGQLLSQRMEARGTNDLAKPDPKDALPDGGRLVLGPDGQPLAASNALPVVDPEGGATILGSDAAHAASAVKGSISASDDPATKPATTDVDDPAGNDPAGNGLAAQLALVSQWAALPPATSATPAGHGTTDALDVKGKLDTVRITSAKPAVPKATTPGGSEEPQATLLPVIATNAPQIGERTLRGASTTTAAVTRAADLKAKVDAQATSAGDRQSLAEAILGKVEPAAGQAQNDAASPTSAFGSQFNAQINAQAVTQAANAQIAVAGAASTPTLLHEPVGTTAWSHEVGQATLRMAANDLQNASLRLNPEHLGPLDVQVRIDNGVAHLAFSAAHAETRQALESSRTTLDQLFAEQGLKIGDCAVGDSSAQRRFDADAAPGGSPRDGGRWGAATNGATDTTASTVTTTVRRALGLVDTFA